MTRLLNSCKNARRNYELVKWASAEIFEAKELDKDTTSELTNFQQCVPKSSDSFHSSKSCRV